MKKLLLILLLSLGLIGCSSTAPEQVKFDSESYDWKRWDCYAYGYGGKYLLTIGYIPELKKDGYALGKLFLKDAESPIDTIYELKGVQHHWVWGDFKITIESDGTGRFYDFTGVAAGVETLNKETYECTSSGFESFDKTMDNIFSY